MVKVRSPLPLLATLLLAACGGGADSSGGPDAGPEGTTWYVSAMHQQPDFADCGEEITFELVVRNPGAPGYVEGFEDVPCEYHALGCNLDEAWCLSCFSSASQTIVQIDVPWSPPRDGRLEIMDDEITGGCAIVYDATVEVE